MVFENINAGKMFLNRMYGKYNPQMTMVSKEYLDSEVISKFNVSFEPASVGIEMDGRVSYAYLGDYRVNAKGTKIFELSLKGKDLFVCLDWGGCFNDSRGSHNVKDAKYVFRASSNGGGSGCTFFVLPLDYKQDISEDEI